MQFVYTLWHRIESAIVYSNMRTWAIAIGILAVVGLYCLKGFGLKKAY